MDFYSVTSSRPFTHGQFVFHFSRSSSAVSSSSRIPSGLGRVRSLTDDPKLLTSPRTSPLHSNNSVNDNDRTAGEIKDAAQNATPSNVVSLPPVRKTKSNPTATHDSVTKPSVSPRQQQTLLNIQKDVEWLAKHQSRQRSNAVQTTISQGEMTNTIRDSNCELVSQRYLISLQRSLNFYLICLLML